MLAYSFLQRAFVVAILISIMLPLVGNVLVLKRLSSVGDALSHNSLAGVAIGLFLGINPVFGAIVVTIFAGICIEFLRRTFPQYSEVSTNVILSLGVGLASVFSGFINSPTSFNSFLFGSIVIVSTQELYMMIILCILVILFSIKYYKELLYITFDEEGAKVSGVKVGIINFMFIVVTSAVIAISARTVGALVISTLIVLPVACAMQVSSSYKLNIVYSIGFAMVFTVGGITLSFYHNLKPGGTMALIGVLMLVILLIGKVFLWQIIQKLEKG
jgi:zinc transport system permease protein